MTSFRIAEFDLWRAGYGNANVFVYVAGTTTLASIFFDEALTQQAANPQRLIELIDSDGTIYGKFAQPLYIGVSYQLQINGPDTTGVVRPPLTTLDGQDVSNALVTVTGGNTPHTLADELTRIVDVRDYGSFLAVGAVGASATTNNATLLLAIGSAAALGGAYVQIPAGTYQVTQFTVPQGVVLRGAGRGSSILQSTAAGNVATIGGTRAGFFRITLDGVSLVGNSVGVRAQNIDNFILDDTEIKRFETGIWCQGGQRNDWKVLYISNCVNGYRRWGDSASGLGSATRFNRWTGGKVDTCTGAGIELKNVDNPCEFHDFVGVVFDTNTQTAVNIIGARYWWFRACRWIANTTNIAINDGSPVSPSNTVLRGEFMDCEINTGALIFTGAWQQLAFRRCSISQPAITINAPGQNIQVEDCNVSSPTFTGVQLCWLYDSTSSRGLAFSQGTGAGTIRGWFTTLKSGQRIFLEAKIVGRQNNGINTGFWHFVVSAERPAASLAYNTQTVAFTLGKVLTGQTSGTKARIVANSGTVLSLQDIVGSGFVLNEIIKDELGGSATAGAFSESNAALVGTQTALRAAQKTDVAWDAAFVAVGATIQATLTGDTSQTIEWSVDVEVTSDQNSPLTIAQQGATTILDYHARVGGIFSVAAVIIGATSGATAIVVFDQEVATSGELTLSSQSGTFTSGETINANTGVHAVVN